MAKLIDLAKKPQAAPYLSQFRKNEVVGLIQADFEPLIELNDLDFFLKYAESYCRSHNGKYMVAAHNEDGDKGLFLKKVQ